MGILQERNGDGSELAATASSSAARSSKAHRRAGIGVQVSRAEVQTGSSLAAAQIVGTHRFCSTCRLTRSLQRQQHLTAGE